MSKGQTPRPAGSTGDWRILSSRRPGLVCVSTTMCYNVLWRTHAVRIFDNSADGFQSTNRSRQFLSRWIMVEGGIQSWWIVWSQIHPPRHHCKHTVSSRSWVVGTLNDREVNRRNEPNPAKMAVLSSVVCVGSDETNPTSPARAPERQRNEPNGRGSTPGIATNEASEPRNDFLIATTDKTRKLVLTGKLATTRPYLVRSTERRGRIVGEGWAACCSRIRYRSPSSHTVDLQLARSRLGVAEHFAPVLGEADESLHERHAVGEPVVLVDL